MSAEVKRIIEYQAERQRTPGELIEYLKEKVDKGAVGRIIAIWVDKDDDSISYAPASVERDYRNSRILWDIEQWKQFFVHT